MEKQSVTQKNSTFSDTPISCLVARYVTATILIVHCLHGGRCLPTPLAVTKSQPFLQKDNIEITPNREKSQDDNYLFCQKPGVRRSRTLNNSKRPTSIRKALTHLAASGSGAHE